MTGIAFLSKNSNETGLLSFNFLTVFTPHSHCDDYLDSSQQKMFPFLYQYVKYGNGVYCVHSSFTHYKLADFAAIILLEFIRPLSRSFAYFIFGFIYWVLTVINIPFFFIIRVVIGECFLSVPAGDPEDFL